jgi:hypothetical protein
VVKEREFSAHASQEKGRFARPAKQAESVNHDARERKAVAIRHGKSMCSRTIVRY